MSDRKLGVCALCVNSSTCASRSENGKASKCGDFHPSHSLHDLFAEEEQAEKKVAASRC